MSGVSIGAYFSKKTAKFLEENELFVPEDEDDDEDDDYQENVRCMPLCLVKKAKTM